MKGAAIGRGSDGSPDDGRRGPGGVGAGCGLAGLTCLSRAFAGFLPPGGTGRCLALAGSCRAGFRRR
jgi:hypothetical protein